MLYGILHSEIKLLFLIFLTESEMCSFDSNFETVWSWNKINITRELKSCLYVAAAIHCPTAHILVKA